MPETSRPALVFVDTFCPAPYDDSNLVSGAIGGTEATLLRIARALSASLPVRVLQHNRKTPLRRAGVSFEPLDLDALGQDPSVGAVVVINAWKIVGRLRCSGVTAPLWVWIHTFPGRHNAAMGRAMLAADAELICVSRAQRDAVAGFLASRGQPMPPGRVIPNAVSDGLRPDGTARNPNLLLCASSPHKGLDQTLEIFHAVREAIPGLRLLVADPGYFPMRRPWGGPGVVFLGPLRQADLHRLMRRVLCLFYPQRRFAETFGLVVAEANAVGTPALLHGPLGANAEVAATPDQIVDATDPGALVSRLAAWRERPPSVTLRPEFRLSAVAEAWRELLAGRDVLPAPIPALHEPAALPLPRRDHA